MKKTILCFILASVTMTAVAQEDPIVMRINGAPVTRSEFEYNYNKNNSEGVIDKKSVDEYVDLFVNYKLKVLAALDHQLDTLSSYKKEFRYYRDQQIRPLLVPEGAKEKECRAYYDEMVTRLEGKQLSTVYLSPTLLALTESVDPEDIDKLEVSQVDKSEEEILTTVGANEEL